jgi:hypothetical protein
MLIEGDEAELFTLTDDCLYLSGYRLPFKGAHQASEDYTVSDFWSHVLAIAAGVPRKSG